MRLSPISATLALGAAALVATTVRSAGSKHVQASLVPEVQSIRAGEPFWVGLRLEMADGWHTYWKNPGDSGLPTRIAWTLPEGFLAGPIVWPHPERIEAGPLVSHGYEGEVLLLTRLMPAATLGPGPVRLAAKVNWLECKEACLPGKADLELTLPVSNEPARPAEEWAGLFAKARRQVPAEPSGWTFTVHRLDTGLSLAAKPPAGTERPRVAHFFADDAEVVDYAAPQKLKLTADGFRLDVSPAANTKPATALNGVLVTEGPSGSQAVHVEAGLVTAPAPVAVAEAAGRQSGPAARAGLRLRSAACILNLMPCVLPVLSLKVLAFVRHGGGERGAWRHGVGLRRGRAGLLLAAGRGAARAARGRRAGRLGLPAPVAAVRGLPERALPAGGPEPVRRVRGGPLAGRRRRPGARGRSGLRCLVRSGALATLVATPCTAPFMGSALGFALSPARRGRRCSCSPRSASGMAAPYLLLAVSPAPAALLPRPGAWMETFKQLMGFPMLATVVCAGVALRPAGRRRRDGRCCWARCCSSAWARWIYGRGRRAAAAAALAPARGRRRRRCSVAAGLALGPRAGAGAPPGRDRTGEQAGGCAGSPTRRRGCAELRRGGTPVFVDFTADWCLTCQVNERVALDRAEVLEALPARRHRGL